MESEKLKVIYCSFAFHDYHTYLKEYFKDFTLVCKPFKDFMESVKTDASFIEKMKHEADIFLGDPTTITPILNWKDSNIKYVQTISSGIDSILEHCHENKIRTLPFKLCNYRDPIMSIQMAEYVICHTLNWLKCTMEMRKHQQDRCWNRVMSNRMFSDIRICIFGGTGTLGSIVAKYCKNMGAEVWTVGLKEKSSEELKNYPYKFRNIHEIKECLENCDVICSILPKTVDTDGLFNTDNLKCCKNKPLFINVGRGNVITEDHIIESIEKGYISRAVLDVFKKEPLDKSSKLWEMPEVVITMHSSAISFPKNVGAFVLENIRRLTENEELMNEVDVTLKY